MQASSQATPATLTGAPAIDSKSLAAALAQALSGPLGRLAEATEKLSAAGAPPSREQAIDAALAEIRAGIERLLDTAGHDD